MSYSLERVPNKAYEIPAPPPYAVWVEDREYIRDATQPGGYKITRTGLGQVRHMTSLTKAKSRVSRYTAEWRKTTEVFAVDWTIFVWNQEKNEYEIAYDGKAGEKRALNPLFKTKLKKDQKAEPRPGLDEEVEAALASILGATP